MLMVANSGWMLKLANRLPIVRGQKISSLLMQRWMFLKIDLNVFLLEKLFKEIILKSMKVTKNKTLSTLLWIKPNIMINDCLEKHRWSWSSFIANICKELRTGKQHVPAEQCWLSIHIEILSFNCCAAFTQWLDNYLTKMYLVVQLLQEIVEIACTTKFQVPETLWCK